MCMKRVWDKTRAWRCLNYSEDELCRRGGESEQDKCETGDAGCTQQEKIQQLKPFLQSRGATPPCSQASTAGGIISGLD